MFNMIGFGERAGSGVPDIFSVWESQKWEQPIIEEQYGPDRTIVTLRFRGENSDSSRGITQEITQEIKNITGTAEADGNGARRRNAMRNIIKTPV